MASIMKSLNSISRCQSIYRTEALNARVGCELQACHHTFVLAICRAPGRSQEELAHDICLNKSTVARALTQLEERGYVLRKPNPNDKRELLVYPTDKMLAVLPTVRDIASRWNTLITRDISEEELAVFHDVLLRIEKSARELVGGEGGRVE